ncbi:MAG: FAD:protein FMN transferase [Clostridia bacterium]|nr:FAD:protein FMN transferase [Clostridia bacterium]
MKKMRALALILTLACALSLTGCASAQQKKQTAIGFYLDTVITLTAYVDDAAVLNDALEECGRYERLLSRTVEGSDVWRINHAGGKPVEVSDDTVILLQTARRVSAYSDGAFDVTIAPVSTMWDFTSGAAVVPDADAIARAAALVDYTRMDIEGNTVTLPENMMIDLGGIAKGYIADEVKLYLMDRGVKSAVLSFGGNIVTIGLKPDGSPWKVGIQDIDKPTGEYMLVSLNFGGSTVTSGIYERGFETDGVYYHHILDPATGWPVQNELASVTIFSDSSMWGDALATAAFALGPEKGMALIEALNGAEAVFISRDRSVTATSGADKYLTQ